MNSSKHSIRRWSFIIAVLFIGCVSCISIDTNVYDRISDLEERVSSLERLCGEMNTNISALQIIVASIQQGDYITSVNPIERDGRVIGYTITFANSNPITIYHGVDGKDGSDGQDGADGKDGADGHTPVIGIQQDTDGIWYWTLDGQWLLDANGQKIKAVGRDGKDGEDGSDGNDGSDGVTPRLKIVDGYWYVSLDSGLTWTKLDKATGADGKDGVDGDSMFRSVTVTETEVTFVTSDGQTFVIKRASELSIEFDAADLIAMDICSTRDIHYTITSDIGDVFIEVLSSGDIKANVIKTDDKTGVVRVKTGEVIDEYSKVVVLVSNGNRVIMRTLSIEEKAIQVTENTTKEVADQGGTISLEFFSNMPCHAVIQEDAREWIDVVPDTKALERQVINLAITKNTGASRSASVIVQNEDGTLLIPYIVEQAESHDYRLSIERSALIDLYNSTDGDHWAYNRNWCSDLQPGFWSGVATDDNGQVTHLDLVCYGLNGTIPESIGNLEKLTYLGLYMNGLTGEIPESIGNLVNLTYLGLGYNNLTGTIPDSFLNLKELEDMSIESNRLDGTLSEKLYYSDWWITRYFRMDQQKGYGLKYENVYESTDFSRDGEVTLIQKHTKGPGIALVITAEGFSDRMVADGKFDMVVNLAVEAFFEERPLNALREYFDVYSVIAVSRNEIIDYDLAFETKSLGSSGIEINDVKVDSYIKKVPALNGNLANVTALVLVNKNNACVGPFTYMEDNNYALAVVGAVDCDYVKHEAAGHGLGKLGDEYSSSRVYSGSLEEDYHKRGWYLNIDDTDDPSKVLWKDFLTDPYYQAEGIGIFQGAKYSNWYRSTQYSIMYNGSYGFNPPSRWAIYKRVKMLAGEDCSFEDFLVLDKSTRG